MAPRGIGNNLLADSLKELHRVTKKVGTSVVQTSDITRTHRERLVAAGFLEPIMKGWFAVSKPGPKTRIETAWGSVFWDFVGSYLDSRFGQDWWLNSVSSVRIHAENRNVPDQLVVSVPLAKGELVQLPNSTSLYVYGTKRSDNVMSKGKLRLLTPEASIVNLPRNAWSDMTTDVVSVLGSIRGTSSLLQVILSEGMITRSASLAGALRHLGRSSDADAIISSIGRAGHQIREDDPFESDVPSDILEARKARPAAATRIIMLWNKMRADVLERFTDDPKPVKTIDAYMDEIDERYVSDAYNSLTIEGYLVSDELIEKVTSGEWKPEIDATDFETHNALAARGYWLAFNEVKEDVRKILSGTPAGPLLWDRHQEWFRAMFQPLVDARVVKPHEVSGYRNHPVYLFGSGHVPYAPEAVLDGMDALFQCIQDEPDTRVKAVLAPFLFTYIHPYGDGNGRNGRFLMNALLAEGGFPWTVVPVDRRDDYMSALNAASSKEDICPLAAFVAQLVVAPPPPRPKQTAWPKW